MNVDTMQLIAILVSVVGGFKALEWIIEKITSQHDKAQKIDSNSEDIEKYKSETDKKISDMEKKIQDAHKYAQDSLNTINNNIMKKIDENQAEYLEKIESDRDEYLKGIEEVKQSITEMSGVYQQTMAIVELKIDTLEKNNTRHLEQLKEAQNKHNNLMERTFILERESAVHEEMIKVANKRVSSLEQKVENK